ncbi:MAG TPA: ThuA domain-containing protein [Acidimicrobiales bacterium]|jgi:type 1 glutamine amidotransferase|nr:ThuA domain-containing protein [Acidimicrobiales bacterium]
MATPTLLYVTQVAPYQYGPAGVHGVLDQSATAVAQLAESAGLSFNRVVDVRALDDSVLAEARAVALFTIGETPWSPTQRDVLLEGVRRGRTSVVAVHSATDACYGWDDYRLLVGARFDGHPWTQQCTLDVVEPNHPAVAHLGPTWLWHDEVYQFRELRPDARVLLAARPAELGAGVDPEGTPDAGLGHPLSWCFTEGSGRVFSTSLGHFPHAWETPDYLRHLSGGLEWSLAG